MTAFAVNSETLKDTIAAALGERVKHISLKLGEVTVVVSAADYLQAATTLRDAPGCQFEQLMDVCGVDYSDYKEGGWDGARYCVVLHLLSVSLNQRVRVKVFAPDDDLPVVASVTSAAEAVAAAATGVDALVVHGSFDECRAHVGRPQPIRLWRRVHPRHSAAIDSRSTSPWVAGVLRIPGQTSLARYAPGRVVDTRATDDSMVVDHLIDQVGERRADTARCCRPWPPAADRSTRRVRSRR